MTKPRKRLSLTTMEPRSSVSRKACRRSVSDARLPPLARRQHDRSMARDPCQRRQATGSTNVCNAPSTNDMLSETQTSYIKHVTRRWRSPVMAGKEYCLDLCRKFGTQHAQHSNTCTKAPRITMCCWKATEGTIWRLQVARTYFEPIGLQPPSGESHRVNKPPNLIDPSDSCPGECRPPCPCWTASKQADHNFG